MNALLPRDRGYYLRVEPWRRNLSKLPHDTKKSVQDHRARVPGRNGGTLFPFQKGEGQTPGYNKPASLRETLALARQHSPQAMMTLIRNLHHEDGRISTMSASLILERAWGKPREMKLEEHQQSHIDLTQLSSEELSILLRLAQSDRLRPVENEREQAPTPTIEAKPVDEQ